MVKIKVDFENCGYVMEAESMEAAMGKIKKALHGRKVLEVQMKIIAEAEANPVNCSASRLPL